MRLSPDCVRDILLVVEECEFNRPYTLDRLAEKLPAYSRDMLWYTCLKLGEANFLNLETTHEMGSFHLSVYRILDLTYQGHEFLNGIRDADRWANVKKIGSKLKDFSLHAISAASKGFTDALIDRFVPDALKSLQ